MAIKNYQITQLLHLFREIEHVRIGSITSYPGIYTQDNYVEVYTRLIQENLKYVMDVDMVNNTDHKRLLPSTAFLVKTLSKRDSGKKS